MTTDDRESQELRRLRAREEVLSYLSDWSARLHQLDRREALATHTAEAVHRTTRYKTCWLYIASQDPERPQLELIVIQGDLADQVVQTLPVLPTDGDEYLQEVLISPQPVICVDARTDPRVNKEITTALGNRTIVNLPARLLDRRVGTLGVGTFGDEGVMPPTEHELWALRMISDQLAVALSRRLLSEERKRARKEREHLQAQFLQAQKMESLGLLAGGVAHDFNNLLVGVLGNASLAREVLPAGNAADAYLDAIEIAGQRASELANQMLSYAGRASYELKPVDLAALLQEMLALLAASIPRTIRIDMKVLTEGTIIDADATQLRQVIMNLVTNAAQAIGDAPGLLCLVIDEAQLEGRNAVMLRVSDDGCGMSPEVRARLFDPFYSTKKAGRGLGLAAVLGIVRGHGGEVEVETQAEQGTTFRIRLPRSAATVLREHTPRPKLERPRAPGRVLLIDDEELVRNLGQRIVERMGMQVMLAEDGQDGLQKFKAEPESWAAVIIDLTMPKLSGAEVYEAVRAQHPTVPVLLSSGRPPTQLPGGGNDDRLAFIAKPYRTQDFVDALARVMDSQARIAKNGH